MELTAEKIKTIASTYGNAFYLLDSEQFEKNYTDLSKVFKDIYPHFNLAYSYKTNYTPKLCRIVNEKAGYAEVVSDMEMEMALRVGVLPEKIIWNGPIKDMGKVRQLLCTGGTVNIDSVDELEKIREIIALYPQRKFNLGIRCNFDVGDGVISRFGIDTGSSDFDKVVNFFAETANVHLIGLQCHFAKRSVEYWPARVEGMIKVAEYIAGALGYIPERIDLGGGIFGNMDESLKAQFSSKIPTYQEYATAAATVMKERFPDAKPELLIEPGSALVGDCMRFIGRVETIKKVRGKAFATVLGSQKNISMVGVNPPVTVHKTGVLRKAYDDLDIVGYTCIESDVLYHGYSGSLAVGDYLEFRNCGSYSVVMKPPFIMPNFPILDISKGQTEVIKRGEAFDDLFHTFSF